MATNQDFDELIKKFLTDGIITMQERKVLLKQAAMMGIDEDMAECLIQAQEQALTQKLEAEEKKARGRECPHCRKIIDQFLDVCPICNSPLTPALEKEFEEILENLNKALYELKTAADIKGANALIDKYSREAKFKFGGHQRVVELLNEIAEESKRVAENKELDEIVNNLEDALCKLKDGKDINVAKAIIDRYARQAKANYGDNVKICKLLAEIEVEAKVAESKAKKAAVVSAIAKQWKAILIAAITIFIIFAIAKSCQPDPALDPQACIEAVTEALNDNDIAQAEAYCAAFYENHNVGYKDITAIDAAYDAIIRYQTKQLNAIIASGDLAAGIDYLASVNIQSGISHHGTANIVKKYDALFSKLINLFLKNNDLDSAEEAALIWKSKIGNDLSWVDTSCYKLLRSKYQQAERDFSILKSTCDCLAM